MISMNDKQIRFLNSKFTNPVTLDQREHNEDILLAKEYLDLGYMLGKKELQSQIDEVKEWLDKELRKCKCEPMGYKDGGCFDCQDKLKLLNKLSKLEEVGK